MSELKMFEIDPKLFVTCRLCLDNMGAYQIVPSVQKQIKFCYEIEVDPFDALPQLICRDCESILRKYFEVKTKYLEKQNKLRERLEHKNVTDSPAVQQEDNIETSSDEICSKTNNLNRKRIFSFHSSLSEASDGNFSVKSKDKRKNSCESSKETDILELGYKKWFICRFCNHQCKSKSKIIRHIKKHSSMQQKYFDLIQHDCYVKLDKVDNKSNICKSKKYVVHSSDRIIHSSHNFYYVVIRKENANNMFDRGSSPEPNHISRSDNSDDDIIPVGCKNRRRKNRILSNDTVVIGNNDLDSRVLDDATPKVPAMSDDMEVNENECINIDSDTESFKSGEILNDDTNITSSVNNSESKTINNIISLCFKRHLKRLESDDCIESNILCQNKETHAAKLDSNLKHKVLSIGKKMINNSAFSCIGILRYLEHQHLEIVWTPKMSSTSNKKPDCVRIMMKLKSPDENDGESGWKILENPTKVNSQHNHISDSSNENELVPKTVSKCNDKSEQNSVGDNTTADSTQREAILHPVVFSQEKDRMLNKLLNENPVANPKKLIKKPKGGSLSLNNNKRKKSKDKSGPLDMPIVETSDNMMMPVITSTVSLADRRTTEAGKQQQALSNLPSVPITLIAGPSSSSSTILSTERTNTEQEPAVVNFPRIKVKPVSQLMSNSALNIMAAQSIPQANMFQSQNMNMAYQNNSNGVIMNISQMPRSVNATGFQMNVLTPFDTNSDNTMSMAYENTTTETVVMHSVEMPNTRTNSPFAYLKRLLQIHNVYLLSLDEIRQDSINSFICLLKFKLVFQQESASPVALCLALFNLKDKFFVKVKGLNDVEINLSRLSPNWQWEILKVYSGDVVKKMLANAQKVSSEVFENTRKFVCYLNSIEFRKNV